MIRPSSTRSAALGLAAALVAGTIALAAPASAATDTTKPALGGAVSFAPATVDVTDGDGETTASMRLTDDSSGVADATLTLVAPGGGYTTDLDLTRATGTPTDGTWTGLQTFSALFDAPGVWKPTQLSITDGAENSVVVTTGLGSGVTVTRTSDTVAPTLLDATTTVTAVDTTAGPTDALVRVSATDDLSGVESGTVTFTSPDGDLAEGYLSGDPVQGTSTNGKWDVAVTFPARSAPGVWRLTGITLADGQYNVRDYDTDDAELPSLAIRVSTSDDAVAPTLTSFSVGPAKRSLAYGTSGYVYAQVGFADAVSGVDSVQVTLLRPGGVADDTENYPVTFADTDLKTGTSRDGTLTVPLYVEGFAAGVWKVASVALTDLAGNTAEVPTARLPGSRTTFEVTTAGADTVPPTSSGVAFSPDTLDTRTSEQSGTVLVAAADPDAVPSGVAGGSVTLTSPSRAQTAVATFDADNDLASGDPANGTFRAGFALPRNAEDGAWTVTSLTLTDAGRRSATTTGFANAPTLTVLGEGRAPATAPGAPTIGNATIADTTATVSWTAPTDTGGARITGYTVTAYRGGTAVGSIDTTALGTTMSNLSRGQSYSFSVVARNAAGTGPASASSNVVTVPVAAPGAPTIGSASVNGTTATVTWTAPTVEGGAPITGYVVTPYLGATKQPATRVGGSGSATIADLARGRTYTFRVAATNTAGDGAPSQPSNSVSVAATVPAAPAAASAHVAGTSATVAWKAPADGGAPITAYRVTGSPAGSCSSTGTSCTVTGLTPDVSYSFTVSATNVVGNSVASAPSPVVVAARPTPSALTVLSAPAKSAAGVAITVAGRLTVAGSTARAVGQQVRLQYRAVGNGAWTTWPTAATTGSDGVARVAGYRPTRSMQVRLVSIASDAYAPSTSAARTVVVGRVLTLGSRSTSVKRGKTMTLTGRATPVRAGGVVTLQRVVGGRWKTVTAKRVDGSSFAFAVRSTKRGSYTYRVVTTGDTAYAASASNTRTLRVR